MGSSGRAHVIRKDRLHLLVGFVSNAQGQREHDTVDDRPEHRRRADHAEHMGDTGREEPVQSSREELKDPAKQPGHDETSSEHGQRHRRDAHWLHAADVRHPHQNPHRVLPGGGPPEKCGQHDESNSGGGSRQHTFGACAGNRQLEIRPEPASPCPERIAERQRHARDDPLKREGPRQQTGRHGEREEERADEESNGRQVSDQRHRTAALGVDAHGSSKPLIVVWSLVLA
jgi:hypothetical protein